MKFREHLPRISEYIIEIYKKRKSNRTDTEKDWKEIDRQIEMTPDVSHKMNSNGKDQSKAWMPEVELPLQAQALEVLKSDTDRLLKGKPWFDANAAVTDEYLQMIEENSIIMGDRNDVPSLIDQDNVNKIVQGAMLYWQRQYDFWGNLSQISGEGFKYGTGIGRARVVEKSVYINKAKGTAKKTAKIPVLFPTSIKNTYLDDTHHNLLNEGYMIGPSTIFYKKQKIADIMKAARNGTNDANKENGGWMPQQLVGIDGDKENEVEVLEWEGDLILPKEGTGFVHIPNALISVVIGFRSKQQAHSVFRFRLRNKPYSTYIEFPYHKEHIASPYATSPLIKGYPLQRAASETLMRAMIAAQMNGLPPISYDPDDPYFSLKGGLPYFPGAQWPVSTPVQVHSFGDISALFAMYQGLLQQYSDVTGISPARLGAQTVSHTTAFAKDVEQQRGASRTIDYADSTLDGPLTIWLNNCYDMGRDNFTKTPLFIDAYGGFVEIEKKHLPDLVTFEAFGAGGPAEEQAKVQNRLTSMQTAMSLDQLKLQAQSAGMQPSIDIDAAIQQVLRDGGWTDVEVIAGGEGAVAGTGGEPNMEDVIGETGATAPATALENIADL